MQKTAVAAHTLSTRKREALVVVAHGFAGWALCAATMGIGMSLASLQPALIIHAAATPFIFVCISVLYFRRQSAWPPLRTAVAFLTIVAALDVFVVALVILRSFAMFASILGVWLPFLSIFVASYLTGLAIRWRITRSTAQNLTRQSK